MESQERNFDDSSGHTELEESLAAALHLVALPLLRCRPANPLLHLPADFADLAAEQAAARAQKSSGREYHNGPLPRVPGAYRRVRLCPPDAPHFEDNMYEAFHMLAAGSDGIAPAVFEAFLALLIAILPPQLGVQLQRLCSSLARLTVDLPTFQAATKACLLLESLAGPEPCEGRSFVVAEARELITQLLQQQEWLAAIELPPTRSVTALCPLHVDDTGFGLDAAVEAEAHAAVVGRLLAAVGGT